MGRSHALRAVAVAQDPLDLFQRRLGADGLGVRPGALEEVERILRDGNGAERMRAAHAEGGMARVLERLVAETAETLEAT